MKGFLKLNPKNTVIYFIPIIVITMAIGNIYILLSSLIFSIINYFIFNRKEHDKKRFFNMLFFSFFIVIFNIVFSYLANDNFNFYKSLYESLKNSILIFSIFLWFSSFSRINDFERLNNVFTFKSTISTILGLSLVFLKESKKKIENITYSRKVLDLKNENRWKNIKKEFLIFSNWSLDKAIKKSDYLKLKGYGLENPVFFSIYSFKKIDLIFLISNLLLLIMFIFFYLKRVNLLMLICISIYFIEPIIFELVEVLRWHISKSRI